VWTILKKISKGMYNYSLVPVHPNCTKNGYVLEHRIVMENHIGRLLNLNEVVHHKDKNKKNNHISNLELLNYKEHARLHGLEQGKQMVELKCPSCNTIFHRRKGQTYLVKTKNSYTCCSRSCRGKLSRKIQLYGVTNDIQLKLKQNIVKEYRINNMPL